jgi:hypothetical protein
MQNSKSHAVAPDRGEPKFGFCTFEEEEPPITRIDANGLERLAAEKAANHELTNDSEMTSAFKIRLFPIGTPRALNRSSQRLC